MRQALHCIVLAVVLLGDGSVSANTELLKTHAGSLVHWTRKEITVGLASSDRSKTVTQEGVVLALRRAAQAWNAIRAGQPQLHFVTEPGPEVTIKFCQGKWRGDTIDLGNSKFTASLRDGTVEAATVELNECDHPFTEPAEATEGRYDLQSVMTHELGHVLGLGHSDNPAAIMYPSGGGVGMRTPHAEDKTALAIIYFGRASAHATREIDTDVSQVLPDPLSPRPSIGTFLWEPWEGSQTLPRSGSARQSPATPTRLEHEMSSSPSTSAKPLLSPEAVPANLLSVLSLTTNGGRQVFVYTCEPTLLPPMAAAPSTQSGRRPPSRRARDGSR